MGRMLVEVKVYHRGEAHFSQLAIQNKKTVYSKKNRKRNNKNVEKNRSIKMYKTSFEKPQKNKIRKKSDEINSYQAANSQKYQSRNPMSGENSKRIET